MPDMAIEQDLHREAYIGFPPIKGETGFLTGIADEHWFVGPLNQTNAYPASVPTLHLCPSNLKPIVDGIGRSEPYDFL